MRLKFPSELTRIKVITRPFAISKYIKNHEEKKLHLGCGVNMVEGWLNADKFKVGADIYFNAYKKFPFQDNTFDCIYAEHLMEHIKIEKVQHFLSEAFRTLKTGGIFRISVPDLELFAHKYVEDDKSFFDMYLDKYRPSREAGNPKHWLLRSKGAVFMSMCNKRFFHHRWMYDFETIKLCSEEIGYSQAIKQAFRKSVSDSAAKMDKESRKHESVYVDLIK